MKQTQRDIKYIIKRILIGVGITLILFNLKKCDVYALNSSDYYFYSTNSTTNLPNFSTSKPCTSSSNSCYHLVDSLEYDNSNIHFYYYNYNNRYHDGFMYLFQYNNNYYIFATYYNATSYDYSNIAYLKMSVNETALRYPPNLYAYDSNDESIGNFATSTTLNNPAPAYPFAYKFYTVDFDNVSISENSSYSLANNILSTGELLATNTDIPTYYGDRLLNQQDPLSTYTKVDLTGYQAVLLVPKNYQTMLSDSSHTIESPPGTFRTYLDLEYYSQECVRGTLINVENVQDIMLNNIGVGTGNIAESVTGTCYQEPTQTIMSYEFDQYSGLKARGLLVYNGSQDWQSGFGTETPFFGTSYVWYDPTMYNAYLVESFDNFNQTISYKDYSGEDQEVIIESLPTFTESMENAIENVDSPSPTEVNKQKLQAIFNFLKTPFTFLNKLNTTSCTAIDLPFPRSNQAAHIECLSSSVYDRYLPSALKSIIVIIINGLLFYRCTLSNIDIFTNILDPEDNKLEAMQL